MRQETLSKNFRRSSRQCTLYLRIEKEAIKYSRLMLVMKKRIQAYGQFSKSCSEMLETRDPISINTRTSHHVSSHSFFMIIFGSLICVLTLSILSAYHKRFMGKNPPSQDVIMPWKGIAGFHINIQDSFILLFRFLIHWHFNCIGFWQWYNDYLPLGFIRFSSQKNPTLSHWQSQR